MMKSETTDNFTLGTHSDLLIISVVQIDMNDIN